MPEQLVLPFEVREARGREHFIVAPCNDTAVRFIDLWPDWPVKSAAIYGPPGSGKSHLVQVWLSRSWGTRVPARGLNLDDLPSQGSLAIEDVDSSLSKERDRTLMYLFDSGREFLLTGEAPPSSWRVLIPDVRSRFDALAAFPLWAPDDRLLAALARKLFADRQLTVTDAVLARMIARLPRVPAAIQEFVARLDQAALSERRPISERLVNELLDRGEG